MTMEAIRTSTILLRDCFIHEQESKTIKRKFIGQHENTDTFSGEFIKQGKILLTFFLIMHLLTFAKKKLSSSDLCSNI
jgi:hypothetical protein